MTLAMFLLLALWITISITLTFAFFAALAEGEAWFILLLFLAVLAWGLPLALSDAPFGIVWS